MDLSAIVKLVTEAGVGIVAIGAVIFMSWKLLSWGKGIVDKVLQQAAMEREAWQRAVSLVTTAIDNLGLRNVEAHNIAAEAHKYQREEHAQINASINKVSDDKHQEHLKLMEFSEKILQTADGILAKLDSMNGKLNNRKRTVKR